MWGPLQIDELRSGRAHNFRVRAVNAKGEGPWSSVASAETLPGPPSAPEAPQISGRTSTSVRLRWQPPQHTNGAEVVRYRCADVKEAQTAFCRCLFRRGPGLTSMLTCRLEVSSGGQPFACVYDGKDLACKLEGLAPCTEHNFRLQAINSAGCGPWSETAVAHTNQLPPRPPRQLSLRLDECVCVFVLCSTSSSTGLYSDKLKNVCVQDGGGGQLGFASCRLPVR